MAAKPGVVLALDLGTTFGFCFGEPGQVPRSGSIELIGSTRGATLAAFYVAACDLMEIAKPVMVVYESPFVRGEDATRLLFGLAGLAEMIAHDFAAMVRESNIQATRRAVLGQGTFPKNQAKKFVMDWCQRMKLVAKDDNAADATVLWHHQIMLRGWRIRPPEQGKPVWTVPA